MTVVHTFITSYGSEKELLNFIKTPEFFYKISNALEPNTFRFEPNIENNLFSNKFIKWPQSIIYKTQINIIYLSLPEMEVKQEYKLIYDQLQCKLTIHTDNMGTIILNSKMDIYETDEEVGITITCEEPAGYFIPSVLMEYITSQLTDTLRKIF